MQTLKFYRFEYLLIVTAILLSIAGFWKIFFGADATPTPYHVLHITTVFVWLLLLLVQLSLIGKKTFVSHKTLGLSILFFGPLLVASTALLSVHSARKGMVSGAGDALLVQNVMGTLELGFLIVMAFVMKKKRAIHGAFLLSTTLLFMGIALFFTLLSFVPQFKIEGPETFYRFGNAALTGLGRLLIGRNSILHKESDKRLAGIVRRILFVDKLIDQRVSGQLRSDRAVDLDRRFAE